jgi:glycosyltransferase involved in cell wall biosynthesis
VPRVVQDAGLGARLQADSVYFLLFGGWREELQSNRWHFAVRWARHLPVVLVLPLGRVPRSGLRRYEETRIPGCTVLEVRQPAHPGDLTVHAESARCVFEHMREARHKRPLLWAYNPHLLPIYACVPAIARVVHATEDYYRFPNLEAWFLRSFGAMIESSDLTVAVSAGVAAGIHANVGNAPLEIVTNGCDFGFYSTHGEDEELRERAAGFERVAVFAGNINGRLDYELLGELAAKLPSTFFAFFGPERDQDVADMARWRRLRALSNVHSFGPVPVSRLPDVYATASLGIIPYRDPSWIVEGGFPLKALEMAATGLPVISSHMKQLIGLAAGLRVARTRKEFIDLAGRLDRVAVGENVVRELIEVAARHDYDRQFAAVVERVASVSQHDGRTTTVIDPAFAAMRDEWMPAGHTFRTPRFTGASISRSARSSLIEWIGLVPPPIRRIVPKGLRGQVLARLFAKSEEP